MSVYVRIERKKKPKQETRRRKKKGTGESDWKSIYKV